MRKRNSVAQLNKRHSHRKAMMRNMATSLFEHERITTTRAKSKALRSYAEKLITKAKRNLEDGVSEERKLHNKRLVMSQIRDRAIVVKLFEDIAPRFANRNGGYLRIIHLPKRKSDASDMSIIEFVERKEKTRKIRPAKDTEASAAKGKGKADKKDKAKAEKKTDKGEKKGKWYDRFRKKKKQHDFE